MAEQQPLQDPSGIGETSAPVLLVDEETARQAERDSFWSRLDQIRGLPQGVSRLQVGFAGELDAIEDGSNEA